jgi:hypothetical protein
VHHDVEEIEQRMDNLHEIAPVKLTV